MWRSIAADLRHGLRLLTRRPGFSTFAILTLGVGVASAVTVFTLVEAVLLRQLPFAQPDRLMWIYNLRTERDRAPLSIPDLEDYRRDTTAVDAFAAFTNWSANLTGAGDAERLEGLRVAGNFFHVLGARASVGRVLGPDDERDNASVAVVTDRLWRRALGGERALVGRKILLNGVPFTVVGVLEPGFVFPFRDADIGVPLAIRSNDARRGDRGANFLRVIARLKPQVTVAQARDDLNRIARRLQKEFPVDDARKVGISVYPLQIEIVSDYEQILWALFASVAVLLAVACGNLANVLLVRANARTPELTVRVAVGATRGMIARQLVIEATLVALSGGVLGFALAAAATTAWRRLAPAGFPRIAEFGIDGRVVAFTLTAIAVSVVIAGIVPAITTARTLVNVAMGETRSTTGSRRQGFVRRAFVVLQITAAVVLIVAMVLVARGFVRLEHVDPGFTPDHALSVQLSLPPARYSTRDATTQFADALATRLRDVPGIRVAGAVSPLPLSGILNTLDLVFPDRPAPPPDEVPQAHIRMATPDYFEAAGIRVLQGRTFQPSDNAAGRPVAIVSRTLAEHHWPGRSAVGQHVQLVTGPGAPTLEVVGVVADVKQFAMDRPATPDLYAPVAQTPTGQNGLVIGRMYWVARTDGDPRRVESGVRAAIRAVDADVAASGMRTLDEVLDGSLDARRLNVTLLEWFGAVAVILSAMGVYAMAAFAARSRLRELAVRSAIGAGRLQLTTALLRGELPSIAMGATAGAAAALAFSRLLQSVAFDVSVTDPLTYAGVALGVFAIGTAAAYVPAHRASRVDPAELLRS